MTHHPENSGKTIRNVAEDLKSHLGPQSDLTVSEISRGLLSVGTNIVQKVTLDTKIDTGLLACPDFKNHRINIDGMTVGEFLSSPEAVLTSNYMIDGPADLYLVSWAGDNPQPFGIRVGPHILDHMDSSGTVWDVFNQGVGIYDFISDEHSSGQAIIMIIQKEI